MNKLQAIAFYLGWTCMELFKFFSGMTTKAQGITGMVAGLIAAILYVLITNWVEKRKLKKYANDNIL